MRVAIVNDLALAREVLRRLVLSVPGYAVAWTAADGAEAVRRAAADRPDAILMDLVMPVLDGVEATRRIMTASPCPILLVTSSVSGNFNKVYEAMGHGGRVGPAADVKKLSPPSLDEDPYVAKLSIPVAGRGFSYEFLIRESELPVDVLSIRKKALKDLTQELLRGRVKEYLNHPDSAQRRAALSTVVLRDDQLFLTPQRLELRFRGRNCTR